MLDVFTSPEPRPELAEEMSLFLPLIGSWDLVVENFERDGSVAVVDGEWHFGWALDGRAVADVWISPARRSRREYDGKTVLKEEAMPDGRLKLILKDEATGEFSDAVVDADAAAALS